MGRTSGVEGSDQYLIEHVRDALARNPALGELELQVAVEGNVIVVSGVVQTSDRREAISEILGERFPDYEVRNQTTVMSSTEQPRVEKLS